MKIIGNFQPRVSPYEMAQIRRELQEIYDSASKSAAALDVDETMRWTTPDFHVRSGGRNFNREEWTAQLRLFWKQLRENRYCETIKALDWDGKEARVQVKSESTKRWKSNLVTESECVGEDVWSKTLDGWRIKSSTLIESKHRVVKQQASQNKPST